MKTSAKLSLKEDALLLDEAVVIGCGTARTGLTGSVIVKVRTLTKDRNHLNNWSWVKFLV